MTNQRLRIHRDTEILGCGGQRQVNEGGKALLADGSTADADRMLAERSDMAAVAKRRGQECPRHWFKPPSPASAKSRAFAASNSSTTKAAPIPSARKAGTRSVIAADGALRPAPMPPAAFAIDAKRSGAARFGKNPLSSRHP